MASKKIKGITIEIDGDTTKLGKALESAESSSKSLQSELKGINSLLKLDPSNVELLAQKQKVLTDAISSTEDKLNTLKDAQKQVQAQFEKGDITAEQYRDFQREIINTEKKLQSLKDEMKDFGSVTKQQMEIAGDKIKELGGKVEDAGKKMAGVSTIASAGLVASAKSAADNEAAINKYIASTGKAVSETGKYKDLMETIYQNNYGESIADVADKMRIVSNILGDLPEEELQKVVEKSYMLQDAYDMDFQENIRGVNSLMDQFGITADQAYELINQGAQKGLNQNQDLTDQIAEYSVYYRQLGFTADEFFNVMVNGAQTGAYQIDYLNDAMKEFGIRVIDGSDSTKQAFEDLGLNADNTMKKFAMGGDSAQQAFNDVVLALNGVDNQIKYNEIGVALFGTKWEDLGSEAVYAMTDAAQAVSSTGNTVEQTTETMYGGTSAKAQEALRSIQTAFASLGEALLPIIAPIAEKIAELANKFSQLSPTMQKIILVVTGIVAAFAPVTIIIGKVITSIGTITKALGKLAPVFGAIKTAISGLFTLIAAHPVVAIVTGIIALIVLLWNKCEWFRNAIKAIWETIKAGFEVAVEFIGNILTSIGDFFAGLYEGVKNGVVTTWNFIVGILTTVGQWIYDNVIVPIMNFFTPLVEWFKQLFMSIYNTLASVIQVIIGIIQGLWLIITTIFGKAASWFNEKVIQPVAKFFKGLWNGISKAAQTAWNFIKGVFGVVANWFNKTIIQPVSKFFSGMWNTLKDGAKKAWEGIKSIFGSVAKFFSDVFGKAWNGVKNIFSVGGRIFDGIKDGIVNAFKTIVNGIIGGINKVVAIPFNAINSVLNTIRNISFLGISPFKGLGSITVPQIPKLATGDVAKPNKPYMAILGDNKTEDEVISPVSTMKEAMMDALTSFTNTRYQNGTSSNVGELTRLLKQYMPMIIDNMGQDIVLDDRTLVGKIAPRIDKQLGVISANKSRGY